jgi:ribosomal protein S18 acetylase RimI-like enzyme
LRRLRRRAGLLQAATAGQTRCVEQLTTPDISALDNPVGESLRSHHAAFALTCGRTARYAPAVATFSAVPVAPESQDWSDLAALLGPGVFADLFSAPASPPAGWRPVFSMAGVQMVASPHTFSDREPDPDIIELGETDVPDMQRLTELTRPGPFWRRSHELGRYVGIRVAGQLIAMAGERLHPPGWTEISAVCTAPHERGRGLSQRLVRDVASGIVARGERPFLHVAADNEAAIALYLQLGFDVRREVRFHGYRTPAE